MTITVTAVNDAPVADRRHRHRRRGHRSPAAIDVLANDTDVDGDTLTVTAVTAAGNGTVTLDRRGTVTYTPDADFIGTDSFTYTVSDGRAHRHRPP